ncbi:hypothetical protein AGOR_G00050450 [Albula goreensis]|uniref:Coiled-coil domain-containing protein 158 n=1 Tax=Albula goreensis TaxID=1534307 RepID=A0A8T3E0T4_9TELE|nr:hypothetical protein AGOR_G00050450 [Albula goreensis]
MDESTYATEMNFDVPPKRSTNLEMLSEELERQTRETQKLQEQVEHATKRTMERMGRTLGGVIPQALTDFKFQSMDILQEVKVPEVISSVQDLGIQPVMCNEMGALRDKMSLCLPGNDVVDEYSQQVSELQQQLSATHDLHEQQNFHLRQCIAKMQTKLQDSQFAMDTLLDQRVKESQKQADLVGKLQGTITELQDSKQAADNMLLEAEKRVESLYRKQEVLENTLQDVSSSLLAYEKRSAKIANVDQDAENLGQVPLGIAVARVLQDLEAENSDLKGRLLPMEEQLEALKLECQEKAVFMMKEQTERMKQLLTSHDQEVALLTDKLTSSQGSTSSMLAKVDELKKQAERQISVYQKQKTDLESALSSLRSELQEAQQKHREKVAAVEEQLTQAVYKVEEAQKQRDLSRQQAKDMDARVYHLMMDLRKTQEELALEKEQNRRLEERDKGHSEAVEDLRQELDERRQSVLELETLVGSLKKECQALMEKQKSAEKQQIKMQENATRLRSELKAARDQLQQVENERAGEQVTKEELEHELKMMQSQLEEQGHEIQRLQGLLEEQGHEVKRLQGLLKDQDCEGKKLKGQLKEQQCEGKKLQSRLDDQEYKIKRLRGLLDEQRQKGKRLQGLIEEKEQEWKTLQDVLEEQKCEGKRMKDHLEEQKHEEMKLRNLLEDREQELQQKEQSVQLDQARLQEAQGHAQALTAEGDTLRLKLDDKEKTVELLQLQMEGMTQLSLQHSHTIEVLQEEKKWLISEIDKHQLEIHRLKTHCEQRGHILGALEQEQVQQKDALSEKTRTLHKLMLDKQQLTAELEVQHMQLLSLTEEHETLKKTHVSKTEELEDIAAKLRSQLQSVHTDLYQAQSTLRTVQGTDEHGMKAALGMQKRITAKREKIDTLQSQIQMLEETTDKLNKEKRQQAIECKRQSQELASVTIEKKQLQSEVEALRYLEKQLRDKVGKFEGALDKISERFSECQDFIQQQEQEYMRLKLHHALDIKELQGQNLRASGTLRHTPKCSPPLSTQPLRPFAGQLCEDNPTMELRTLVKELRSMMDENDRCGPNIRSSPERAHVSHVSELNEVIKHSTNNSPVNRKTTSTRDTGELEEGNINSTFSSDDYELSFTIPPCYTSSPRGQAAGHRSPVHSLLTSTPYPTSPTKSYPEKEGPFPDLNTRKACKKLQGKLDSMQSLMEDLKNEAQEMSSLIKTEDMRMRKVKDRSKLSNGLGSS